MTLDMTKVLNQKKELEERMSRGGGLGARFWRPQNGSNKIRLMPGWTSDGMFQGQFWREVAQHWGVSEDMKGPLLCPKNTPGVEGDCPVCAFVTTLREDRTDVSKQELARDIRAKTTYLLGVVDLGDAAYTASDVAEYKQSRPDSEPPFAAGDPKVQIYACPPSIFDQVLGIISQNKNDITCLETGRNVFLKKFPHKDKFKTRYEVTPDLSASVFALPEAFVLPALDKVGAVLDYAKITTILSNGVGGALPASLAPEPAALTTTAAVTDADALEKQLREAASL
tara:strand:- start:14505 stop:15353 length:849 start_codon:yes stop_codon:yes gene_type:complete